MTIRHADGSFSWTVASGNAHELPPRWEAWACLNRIQANARPHFLRIEEIPDARRARQRCDRERASARDPTRQPSEVTTTAGERSCSRTAEDRSGGPGTFVRGMTWEHRPVDIQWTPDRVRRADAARRVSAAWRLRTEQGLQWDEIAEQVGEASGQKVRAECAAEALAGGPLIDGGVRAGVRLSRGLGAPRMREVLGPLASEAGAGVHHGPHQVVGPLPHSPGGQESPAGASPAALITESTRATASPPSVELVTTSQIHQRRAVPHPSAEEEQPEAGKSACRHEQPFRWRRVQ